MPNWREVLDELQQFDQNAAEKLDIVRRRYLSKLSEYTGRNVIAYYSGYMSKPGIPQSDIVDEDKNGFMMAVHKMDRSKGLDLILHTPGGSIAATQSIVHYLQCMFDYDIRAIVPQQAMSAGTMIACSCKSILMAKHSNLGPIDPHLRGVPAYGVIEEFRRACKEVREDPSRVPLWQSIVGQYRPSFLSQCEQAINWSNEFVEEQLKGVMFKGLADGDAQAEKVVNALANYHGNKTHERHIHYDECHEIGLNVTLIEDDDTLQDLVMTVHHAFIHVTMNTSVYKIIENQYGNALIKNVAPSRS